MRETEEAPVEPARDPESSFEHSEEEVGPASRGAETVSALRQRPAIADRALKDLVIVETGVGMAAPLVTRMLADAGGFAIKLESRGRVDFNRGRLKPVGMTAEEFDDIWPQIHDMSCGKASVTVNLKSEEGRRVLLDILDHADVWIQNYVPGWLERLGLSLAMVQSRSPHLIILAQSPNGGTGPKRTQRAYAPIMTSLAGVESLVGYEDGRIISQVSSAIGDLVAAYYACALVLAAIYERGRTGCGVLIDQSQTESSAMLSGLAMTEYQLSGEVPRPVGNRNLEVAPHGIYPAAGVDRWVALAVWDDAEWQDLCDILGVSRTDRERFATNAARLSARTELDTIIGQRTELSERDALCRRLQARAVSCTPVLDCYEADEFGPLLERDLYRHFESPQGNDITITQIPWRFDGLDLHTREIAEGLGASTDRVVRDLLGLDDDELARLKAADALT